MKPAGAFQVGHRKRGLSGADVDNKLVGYIVVSKKWWPFVRYSTHVRYQHTAEKGGEFRIGGFVVNNPIDIKNQEGVEKRYIKLQNNFDKKSANHKEWVVPYDDIDHLYAKGTGTELTFEDDLMQMVEMANANFTELIAKVNVLNKKVNKLAPK